MAIETHMRQGLNPKYVTGLKDLIHSLPAGVHMAEIGCYAGESTKMFLEDGRVESLVAIDPYIAVPGDEYMARHPMSEVEGCFIRDVMVPYPWVRWMKLTSIDAARVLEREGVLLDFVYIDGDHRYESVKMDIDLYRKLIKPGGIIAGHDYNTTWNSVVRAVNEAFGQPDMRFDDDSWLKRL